MERVYLDANYLIDIFNERTAVRISDFEGMLLCVSPLSLHILSYIEKISIPHQEFSLLREFLFLVPMAVEIVENSLIGPTKDFEDNIQLHSAANSECSFFLTYDKKLLGMKFFGKTRIVEAL